MNQPMARVARLDPERVFLGLSDPLPLSEVKAGDFVFGDPALKDALPADAVYVERDCDLASGKYRLVAPHDDHQVWHFVPLADALLDSFSKMVEIGLQLSLVHFDDAGPLGRWAREYYALAAKNFPNAVASHARTAAKR